MAVARIFDRMCWHPVVTHASRHARIALASLPLLVGLLLVCTSAQAAGKRVPSIHVLASGSMAEVLTELARAYSSQHNTTVSITYDNPDVLFDSVAQGEPGHLVITEDAQMMKELKQRGLIEVQSMTILAQDALVVATQAGGRLDKQLSHQKTFDGLLGSMTDYGLLVVANPKSTVLGDLTRQLFEEQGVWDALQTYLIQPPTVQQARYQVEQPNRLGVLYQSMVQHNAQLTTLVPVPESLYPKIYYQAAVIASRNMAGARDFLQFIKTEKAKASFLAQGFGLL